MARKLLLSGDRSGFTTLSFDPEEHTLSTIANYPGPYNVSWVEPSSSHGDIDRLIGLSEGTDSGLLFTFKIDHAHSTCEITSQELSLGAPAHFITLHDGSALALATYLGGSIALYLISFTENLGLLLQKAPRTEFQPEFPYKSSGHGPVEGRQRQCHVHQILESKRGLLYAPDLGADRVWIFRRDQLNLEMCGWLQCPPGTGPRHAVLAPDEQVMYVLGELSHNLFAFDLSTGPAENMNPIHRFTTNIIPPNVHPDHQFTMDSAELCHHPVIPNVLYASNRWERHIAEREPHLQNVPKELPSGDAIAILVLSENGKEVQDIKHIRTTVDTIRGMRFSNDGNYLVVGGQEGGGVEIYEVSGERGDDLTLVASLKEGLESGIKHAVWL